MDASRDRTILHCDCNAFFASVETALNPSLGSGPMAVCGDPESRHGIILAKNEAAKKYGIQTAETIWQAKRKCPELTLVRPHRDAYVEYSRRCNALYLQYTDLVDPFGIDESFLDVTGSAHLFGSGPEIADALRARMKQEVGISISVGVSWNKAFAKLGSDYKKPDATTVFSRENYQDTVWTLPANALLYVGRRAYERLNALGIMTIGDLARCEPQLLTRVLGKQGALLSRYARGEDRERVRSFYEHDAVKSVGNGMTFSHNLSGEEEYRMGLAALCDNVGRRMRKIGVKCQTVQVIIRDPEFHNRSRQVTLEQPTNSTKELLAVSMEILRQHWKPDAPIRMLTVTGANLLPAEMGHEQLSLFEQSRQQTAGKQQKLEQTVDTLREKFGRHAIDFGTWLDHKKK